MILKSDLHIHSSLDPADRHLRKMLSPHEILEMAKNNGFDVVSITHHDHYYHNKRLFEYAKDLDILLIPGIEKTIEGKHVLLYNFENPASIDSFEKLEGMKGEDNLVVCPHPFYLFSSLNNNLLRYINLFDAIEVSHFYNSLINPNVKAVNVASKFNKPLIGNSDMHNEFQLTTTYSNINTEDKNISGIIKAIKDNKVEVVSRPLSINEYFKVITMMFEIELMSVSRSPILAFTKSFPKLFAQRMNILETKNELILKIAAIIGKL